MNTQSLVTWNYTGSDHSGFKLERSVDSGSIWNTVLTCSSVTTSYYDNDVWWASSSWFRVAATNNNGIGPVSAEAFVYINYPGMDIPALTAVQSGSDYGYYSGRILSYNNGNQWTIVNNALQNSGVESGSGDLLTAVLAGYYAGYNYQISLADNGISGYGGWAGSMEYCPLTNTVFIGTWGPNPDYGPLVLETDQNLTVIRTYDLSEYTASTNQIYGIDDIKWNKKKRVLELYNYYSSTPGGVLVLDPVAQQIVCNIDPAPLDEIPTGAAAGRTVGINPLTGQMYVPQRFDGDSSALTGSVKVYNIESAILE